MSTHRWPMIVIGILSAVIGACLIAGGAVLSWAQLTQRDSGGFYTSPQYEVTSAASAVVLQDVDLDPGPWWARAGGPIGQLGTVHVTASTADRPVFVGIARQVDLTDYLAGAAYDDVADVSGRAIVTRSVAGSASPAPPGAQDFWAASTSGTGTQEITWPIEDGRWAVVLMNADGAAGLDVVTSAGARIDHLTDVVVVLMVVGTLFLLGAGAALWSGRGPGSARSVSASPEQRQPLALGADLDAAPGRWLWIVKWLLVVPHLVVLGLLWTAFLAVTVVAGLSILVTGRYPRGLFDFNVGVLRWTWRVGAYSYLTLGTDRYPPFTLHDADHPATLTLAYPPRLSRGLVLVKWLLAVPHLLIVGVLVGSGTRFASVTAPAVPLIGGGLIGLLVLVAGGHLVLLGRYPQGLFDLLLGLNRWVFRVLVYVALMTDVYPPFRLDPGSVDPGGVDPGGVDPGTVDQDEAEPDPARGSAAIAADLLTTGARN